MKVGFSPHNNFVGLDKNRKIFNATIHSPSPGEGATLFTFAVIGAVGNSFVMIITLIHPRFRQMSSAFLFHHCLLDTIKSLFCLPFGYSLLMNNAIPHCDVLGAAYMLLMTVSAYNLLALLLNEEYQCSYLSKRYKETQGDTCCIIFGLVMIWFTTVLLHLGVAFLPGSSEFSRDIGNCVYRYGITKNYVIHVLWVLLVTGAVTVAALSFLHFYKKLTSSIQSRTWGSIHKSLSGLNTTQHHHHHPLTMSQGEDDDEEEVHYQFEDDAHFHDVSVQINNYIRRIIILFCMLVSFVVCWYPLFLLTLFDVHYQQPAHLYRILTMIAWVHPLTTPLFCFIIYYKRAWAGPANSSLYRDIYANAIPMTTSKSSYSYSQSSGLHTHNRLEEEEAEITNTNTDSTLSFQNQNFHWGGGGGSGGGGGGGSAGGHCTSGENHVLANNISSSSSTYYHGHYPPPPPITANYPHVEEEAGQTLIM